jgi:hypothetical protein
MTNFICRRVTALGLAGAIALAAIAPVSAAPISGGASLVSALPSHTTEVRWRGRGWGWAGAGVAAGLAIGAIAASRPYYGPDYYYGPAYAPAPVYVEPEPVYVAPRVYAAPAPGYYPEPAPAYGPRQCWVTRNQDSGQGFWRPC